MRRVPFLRGKGPGVLLVLGLLHILPVCLCPLGVPFPDIVPALHAGGSREENVGLYPKNDRRTMWPLAWRARGGSFEVVLGKDLSPLCPGASHTAAYLSTKGGTWYVSDKGLVSCSLPAALADMDRSGEELELLDNTSRAAVGQGGVFTQYRRKTGIPAASFSKALRPLSVYRSAAGGAATGTASPLGYRCALPAYFGGGGNDFSCRWYLVFSAGAGTDGTALMLGGRLEFFPGEQELFGMDWYPAGTTYRQKVLMLLFAILSYRNDQAGQDSDATILGWMRSSLAGLDGLYSVPDPGSLKTIRDHAGEAVVDRALKGCTQSLRDHLLPASGGLGYILRGQYRSLPFFQVDDLSFDSLYSKSPNPYTQVWIALHAAIAKPITSKEMELQYDSMHRALHPSERSSNPYRMPYDWRNYRTLGLAEGKELAAKALEYLVWGVEYNKVRSALQAGSSGVSRSLADSSYRLLLDRWLDGTAGSRSSNYCGSTLVANRRVEQDNPGLDLGAEQETATKSPFAGGGVPLPYTPFGIDSPRTWAWKARELLANRPATLGMLRGVLPGVELATPALLEQLGDYGIWSLAPGVDALGFLGNVIAATSVGLGHYGLENTDKARLLDQYARFEPLVGTGALQAVMDAAGKPLIRVLDNKSWIDEVGALRMSEADVERSTVVLPGLGMVQPGDILTSWDSHSEQSRVGIVVQVNKPFTGCVDADAFFANVLVVGVNQDSPDSSGGGRVRVGLWGSINKGQQSLAFSDRPRSFTLRRLVVRIARGAPTTDTYPQKNWDFVASAGLGLYGRISTCDEQGRSLPGWRWIPNTGEYARFGVELSTRHGPGLLPVESNVPLRLLAPADRNWSAHAADANICNNTGSGFEMVAFGADGKTVWPVCAFVRNPAATSANTAYKLVYRWGASESAVYHPRAQGAMPPGSLKEGASLDCDRGRLCLRKDGSSTTTFGIRPFAPLLDNTICPGDDILLRICPEADYEPTSSDSSKASVMPDASYLAVVDKKLLWRANLYVDETSEEERDEAGTVLQPAVIDWNVAHPWAAPPDAPAWAAVPDADKARLQWWSADWGYNEWNRIHDGTADAPQAFTCLADLPPGKGTQVVKTVPFVPVRDQAFEGSLAGTVPYSYPKHDHEQFAAEFTDGDAGSQDSPFDYNRKMLSQKNLLSQVYNRRGKAWNKPRWEWPAAIRDSTDITGFSFGDYKTYCFEPAAGSTEEGWEQRRTALGWTVESWDRATPPGDTWSAYAVQNPGPNAPATTFLPSFGLGYKQGSNTKKTIESFEERKKFWILEAGTDCVGFAQRAAGWYYRFGGYNDKQDNPYKWRSPAVAWTESEQPARDNIFKVVGNRSDKTGADFYQPDADHAKNRRSYLKDKSDNDAATTIVQTRDQGNATYMKRSGWTDAEKQAALARLRLVIPGDIFVKDSPKNSEPPVKGVDDKQWNNHIAIVASIPDDPMSYDDPQAYMNDMILIEAEFANLIQSVIKKLSVGDYNKSEIPVGRMIYKTFTISNQGNQNQLQGISLNCETWAIRRLK